MAALDYEETSSQRSSRASAVHTTQDSWTYMCWTTLEDTARGSFGQSAVINGESTGHVLAQVVNTVGDDDWGSITDGSAWLEGDCGLTPGAWTHICVVRDGTTVRLYKNGVVQTNTTATSPDTPNAGFHIGFGGSKTGSSYADGRIALVKAWSRSLDSNEIALERWSYRPVLFNNLAAYYPLEEGTGTTDNDFTQTTATTLSHTNTPAWVDGPPVT